MLGLIFILLSAWGAYTLVRLVIAPLFQANDRASSDPVLRHLLPILKGLSKTLLLVETGIFYFYLEILRGAGLDPFEWTLWYCSYGLWEKTFLGAD